MMKLHKGALKPYCKQKGHHMKNQRYILFTILLAITVSMAQENPDPQRFAKAIETFENWDQKNSFPAGATLFVGSSSIRLWKTTESFPGIKVINRGFGGSHISDVIYYFDTIVQPYKPASIIFYAGDNDIAAGKTPNQVLADYKKFVQKVSGIDPGIEIIFLPIKPSILRMQYWPVMQEANNLIKTYIEESEGLIYVDTATPMLDSVGRPLAELFMDDDLHLNAEGYQLWNKILRPYLK